MAAIYRIVIRGHLGVRRAHWFEGMTLALLPSGETMLTGTLPDQSALHGVLTRIRDLGLELISVQKYSSKDDLE